MPLRPLVACTHWRRRTPWWACSWGPSRDPDCQSRILRRSWTRSRQRYRCAWTCPWRGWGWRYPGEVQREDLEEIFKVQVSGCKKALYLALYVYIYELVSTSFEDKSNYQLKDFISEGVDLIFVRALTQAKETGKVSLKAEEKKYLFSRLAGRLSQVSKERCTPEILNKILKCPKRYIFKQVLKMGLDFAFSWI